MEHPTAPHTAPSAGLSAAIFLALAILPLAAHASFLPPEMMDKAAMGLAWFVLIFVPVGVIVLFWLVHVLPEQIAENRHHPQRTQSRPCACCRWCSGACCGRSRGCGLT